MRNFFALKAKPFKLNGILSSSDFEMQTIRCSFVFVNIHSSSLHPFNESLKKNLMANAMIKLKFKEKNFVKRKN